MGQQLRHAGDGMTLRQRLAELRRYLSVGVICAVLHNVIVISASQLGLHYMLALLLSVLVVTPTGYALHTLYTFGAQFSWRQFARFTSGLIGGMLLNLAIMFLLCTVLNVATYVATPVATALLFIWNYSSARWAVLLPHKSRG
jgi:putative flippase GtrA